MVMNGFGRLTVQIRYGGKGGVELPEKRGAHDDQHRVHCAAREHVEQHG